MGPSDNTKLALGVFAATGAVVLSVILLKKFGEQTKSQKPKVSKGSSSSSKSKQPSTAPVVPVEENLIKSELTQLKLSAPQLQIPGDQPPKPEPSTPSPCTPPLQALDGDSQASYVFVSEEGKKAGERSSDESSYDVIDEDEKQRMAADVDEAVEDAKEESLRDTLSETSMVFVPDPEKHFGEISGSSVYASANETMEHSPVKEVGNVDSDNEEEEAGDKTSNNLPEEEDSSGDKTVIRQGEQKSDSSSSQEEKSSSDIDKSKLDESTGDSSFVSMGTTDSDSPVVESTTTTQDAGGEQAQSKPSVSDPVSEPTTLPEVGEGGAEIPSTPSKDTSGKLSPEEIAEVLSGCGKSPSDVSGSQLTGLCSVLGQSQLPVVQCLALDCVVKLTAFSHNNDKQRTAGIPEAVKAIALTLKSEGQSDEEIKVAVLVCQVITNLTLDPVNCTILEPVVPLLTDFLTSAHVTEKVRKSALQPLINFSSDPVYHFHLTRVISTLLDLLASAPSDLRLQCLRLLVNLSLNSELVPSILAAKCTPCLHSLLEPPSSDDIILRTLTFLVNLQFAILAGQLTSESLPTTDKAESPVTVYCALTGVENVSTLKGKVFALTQHGDEDIRSKAGRLHKAMGDSKAQ